MIGITIFSIVDLQAAELVTTIVPHYFHLIEFTIFFTILVTLGILLDLQVGNTERQARTLAILDVKHRLSLALAGADEWDKLTSEMVHFFASLLNMEAGSLFVREPITSRFHNEAYWSKLNQDLPGFSDEVASQLWVRQLYVSGQAFHRAPTEPDDPFVEYSLPIRHADSLLAFLRFRLSPGFDLSEYEKDVINNLGDELALALKAGQARRSTNAMSNSQAALAERRVVSHFLHDTLAQNLGFMKLKLDQLMHDRHRLTEDQLQTDLARMHEAADASYEIVRGTLENIQPKTMPHLANLLQEYARKVAERAGFSINFEVQGHPFIFTDDVQSAIFYVFHEILTNVEKHSQADRVSIYVNWRQDGFQLTISDNGIGFDPETVNSNKHFGLEIMNERINNINGHIRLETSPNSGTIVVINVPLQPVASL